MNLCLYSYKRYAYVKNISGLPLLFNAACIAKIYLRRVLGRGRGGSGTPKGNLTSNHPNFLRIFMCVSEA